MPQLYTSVKYDITAAAKCLPKDQQAAYIQRATAAAKQKPSNCVPGS